MQLTPLIAVHMSAALGALVTGPVALWARRGRKQRPRLHRAFGYAWVTLMLVAAVSALFIRDYALPNIAGYTPIHLLVPVTLLALLGAFVKLARGDIAGHKSIMQRLYFGACIVAGGFTLLPGRYLGNLVWGEWLGLLSRAPAGGPGLLQIVTRTPPWVWALAGGLLLLGLSQVKDRRVGLPRTAVMPLAMGGLAVWGVFTAFGGNPAVLGTWLAAAAGAAALVLRRPLPAGVRYDAAARRFHVPGSWLPLALIAGIFFTKYAVGVSLALQPQLRADPAFALPIAAAYGVFSGIFAGRGLRLLRLAVRPAVIPVPMFNT